MQVVLRWRAGLRAALVSCLVVAGAGLAGCDVKTAGLTLDPPDATDRVRAADLQPKFPKQTETSDPGATRRRPAVYYGSKPEVTTGAIMRPAPGGEKSYDLNFEDTPIATVAKVILGDILAVGYTIDPRVQGTVTLASGRPVPSQDVLFVLESALRTSNVVLVHDVNGYRLVPAAEAVGSGRAERAGTGPVEPGFGVSVLPLQYVSVQTVSKLLDSFAVKAGMVRADTSRNILMIQGSGAERRAAVEAVLSFDHDWMRGQSVGIYPVHNTTPEPLIAELEKIMDSGEGGLGQNLVKFQAIDRLSAILVVTPKPELLRRAETWINRLDASQTAETGVKVYRVRYGEARQLARVLNDIFAGGSGASSLLEPPTAPGSGATTLSSTERLTGGVQPAASTPLTPLARPQSPGGVGGGVGGGVVDTPPNALPSLPHGNGTTPGQAILPGVRITADTVNNALLIYANQENYRIVQRALNQLDRPRLQVAIDLTIAEVTLENDLSYGVQFFLESKDVGLKKDTGSIINSAAGPVLAQALPGFNFLMGSAINPRAILSALNAHTNTKVLSNPSIVVLDNQPATLQVGDQVPITTGTATLLSANNSIVSTVDYKNTGIILRVVPRINSNGNVLLDIEQEISSVANATSSSPSSLTPTLSERKVKSALSVATGQTVLLAGLVSETQSLNRSGIPLLEDIPKIGDVFAQNSKSLQRTELIIFIRPQIIRDSVDASVVAEELRSKLKGDKVGAGRAPRL
jgi:general secretion pathway protein D